MKAWKLFRRDPNARAAARLHAAIVVQARRPEFYENGGVPDSIDGRFEMIALHSYLILWRLRQEGEAGRALSQSLVDTVFADLDASLREMGAGDLGVGKRIKRMATAFYGRIAAYEEGERKAAMTDALARNLFGTAATTSGQLSSMTSYVEACRQALSRQPIEEIVAAKLAFPAAGERE